MVAFRGAGEPQGPTAGGTSAPAPRAVAPEHDELTAVWESASNETYRRDQSHWRGKGRWAGDGWAAIGRTTRAQIEAAAATLGRPLPSGPLLEWGPGGGSNLVAFADVASELYGVDISQSNLAEAGRVLGELDPAPRFTPIVLDGDPENVTKSFDKHLELFISTAVFQHFPSREYGDQVLRTVSGILAPGALGCIQIRYDDGTEKYTQKFQDYGSKHITFTSYPLADFWNRLAAHGLNPVAVSKMQTNINYAWFTFERSGT